jgi:hypothetical protein
LNDTQYNYSLLQYKTESIGNGLIALLGFFTGNPYVFGLVILSGILELTFGFQKSPIAQFARIIDRKYGADQWNFRSRLPPLPVLKINSFFMILIALVAVYLATTHSPYLWLPANLIAVFAILVGVTGICPVAITYALVLRAMGKDKKFNPECRVDSKD